MQIYIQFTTVINILIVPSTNLIYHYLSSTHTVYPKIKKESRGLCVNIKTSVQFCIVIMIHCDASIIVGLLYSVVLHCVIICF